jgi:hypothetical protein
MRNPTVTITIHFKSLLFAASQSLAVNLSGATEREIHHIVCPRPSPASITAVATTALRVLNPTLSNIYYQRDFC